MNLVPLCHQPAVLATPSSVVAATTHKTASFSSASTHHHPSYLLCESSAVPRMATVSTATSSVVSTPLRTIIDPYQRRNTTGHESLEHFQQFIADSVEEWRRERRERMQQQRAEESDGGGFNSSSFARGSQGRPTAMSMRNPVYSAQIGAIRQEPAC